MPRSRGLSEQRDRQCRARFKEHGFNAHRSLWWSEEITDNFTPRDLSGQDHRDYLIACLGRNGLFMWSDMGPNAYP